MSDLMYFDCHALVGQRQRKHPLARWTTEHLLEDMDLAEVSGAAVVHGVARTYDARYGNERLPAELAKAPDRLFGVWCMAPIGDPGFYETGDALIRAMEADGVRAVSVVPGNTSLHPQVMGYTLDVLQHHNVLTLLEAGWGGGQPLPFFHELLNRYPHLPVLLTDASWGSQRDVYRLMQLHENLHLEFSSYQANRAIEVYTKEFGADRLLFGTGMTEKCPGSARTAVDYAQICGEDKRKIAGGNLTRLLKGQGPKTTAPVTRADDPILVKAREGKPLSVPVTDAHAHVLHEGGQTCGQRYMYEGDAAGMLEVNHWCGIDRIAMMSWNGPVCSDAVDGNEIVWRAMQRFGDEIIGAVSIDPSHMSQEEITAEIKLRHLDQGFVGMKPYHQTGLFYDHDLYTQWWEFGNTHRLYALIHTMAYTGGLPCVQRLAERYPEVSWLVAHSGMSWGYVVDVAELVKTHRNVYAEITYTAVTNGSIEYFVEQGIEDNVLFGTDAPMRDPRQQLGWVIWANVPVETRLKILHGNFQRILDRGKIASR